MFVGKNDEIGKAAVEKEINAVLHPAGRLIRRVLQMLQ